ncbi:kinase binding protein CGI-121-domain-containing protein [Stachybotrys elegans]|uniref:EKC/KEOPS complex subunit CGI121 n=1 Tax=Stachybotrys elegans TaxID=80388 RepID=A0A8K0SM83_9HYPO|nr:kinase binding protein CGI-121-domain-containing protein [Stachybotrys elegans]
MAIETLQLEHLPASHKVHVAMFRDVTNASFLHQQLLARNAEFEYAFIDASVLLSRLQLLSAIFKATTAAVNQALKTPNVHSEIVAYMSASNNIADAYRRYGISPGTKDLIVVRVTFPTEAAPEPQTGDAVWAHLAGAVEGRAVPVSDDNIAKAADLTKIRKYYKLNGLNWLDSQKDDEKKRKEMEMIILSGMALRGV